MADEGAAPVLPRTDSASVSVGAKPDHERMATLLAGEVIELRRIVVANLCARSRICTFSSTDPMQHAPLCAAGLEIQRAHKQAGKGLSR